MTSRFDDEGLRNSRKMKSHSLCEIGNEYFSNSREHCSLKDSNTLNFTDRFIAFRFVPSRTANKKFKKCTHCEQFMTKKDHKMRGRGEGAGFLNCWISVHPEPTNNPCGWKNHFSGKGSEIFIRGSINRFYGLSGLLLVFT